MSVMWVCVCVCVRACVRVHVRRVHTNRLHQCAHTSTVPAEVFRLVMMRVGRVVMVVMVVSAQGQCSRPPCIPHRQSSSASTLRSS